MFMLPQYAGAGVPGLPPGFTTTPGGIPTGAVYQTVTPARMKGKVATRSEAQPIYYNPQPPAAPPSPQEAAPPPQAAAPASAPPPPPPAASSTAEATPEITRARDLERRSEYEFDRAYASVPKLQFRDYEPESVDGGGSSYAKTKNNANLATSALLDYAKNVEDFSRHAAEGFRMKALATEERSRDTDNRVISGLTADLGPNPLDVAREENAKAQKRQDELFQQSQHQRNLNHIARMMQLAASAR